VVVATLASLAALPIPDSAGERYYVVLFAFQSEPNLPRFAHTFATFVKATGAGPDPRCYSVQTHTISWCPASREIRVARFCPERGANLDLPATLAWARSLGSWVTRWGPFEVHKELYDRAVAQEARLRSGAVQYKVLDCGLRPSEASNCIHAVSDLAGGALLDTGAAYGEEASCLVAHHLRRWMINPHLTHEWVYQRLGLEGVAVQSRSWGRAPAP
jgi:hypothetical protein